MRVDEGSFRDGAMVIGLVPRTPATTNAVTTIERTASADEGPSPFARVLRRLGKEVDHGEAAMRAAIDSGGKDMSPGALLVLQANVYRYSEAVDLSAKLIDRASSGVKTVIQGQ